MRLGVQRHDPADLPLEKRPRIGTSEDPMVSLDGFGEEKLLSHTGVRTPNRPACSAWLTEYAILAP